MPYSKLLRCALSKLRGTESRRCDAGSESRIVYYDDDEGGILQTSPMVEGEEILAARRLKQFFREKRRCEHDLETLPVIATQRRQSPQGC
jgi:hypothetical protein